jgi:hypothetical protein
LIPGTQFFKGFGDSVEIVLPNRTLIHFSGSEKETGVELKGTLSASHTYDKVIIERCNDGISFQKIGELAIPNSNTAAYPFKYWDANPNSEVVFYRIRLYNTPQRIYEISNTLMIKVKNIEKTGFKVFNTLLRKEDPSITFQSAGDAEMTIDIMDMSGKKVYQRTTKINTGVNVVDMPFYNAGRGYFILVARTGKEIVSKKIFIQ